MNNNKVLMWLAVLVGACFMAFAFVYWFTPANALPSYLPGYDPAMSGVHVKHGLAALVAGLALFTYAWFASGKKSAQ